MRSTQRDTSPTNPPVTTRSAASQPVPPRRRRDVAHQFEALVQLAPDATVVVDGSGRIRIVNHLTEELFGYCVEEMLGQPVEMLVPERLRAVHQQHRATYASAPHVRPMGVSLPLSGRRRDGSEFPIEASLGPLDEGGESLVIVSIRDITERQRLEQALAERVAQLEAVMEAVPGALAVYDTAGRVILANAVSQAHAPAGVTVAERIQHVGGIFDEHGVPLEEAQWPPLRALHGEVLAGADAVELAVHPPQGEPVYSRLTAAPLRDQAGNIIGAVSLNQDITERKRLEREREEARAEAEQQAAQLAAIFEAIADGVVVFDAQGRLARENIAHRHLLGIDTAAANSARLPLPERLALFAARDEHGRPLRPDEGPLPRALRGEVLSGAETMDLRSRTLDGREVDLNVSAAPLRDKDGHLTGAVAIFRDQTERKRLERERAEQAEQLDRIFEGITDGLVVYNAQGEPVRFNAAARRILGLDVVPSEYTQLPASDRAILYEAHDEQGRLLAPEDWPLIRVLSGQVTGADTREIRLRTLNGREVEVISSAAPLRDQDAHLVGAVTILHDQTEQKRLAREREEARAHELALEDVARHMDEFLATASHDLRTPLTVVKSRLQIALRRLTRLRESGAASPPDALPDADLDALHTSLLAANQSADRLTRLVALLFDVSRARSGALELELAPCDLTTLVREQVAAQRMTAPNRTIELVIPGSVVVWVQADTDRLGQVLSNYLSNALKYSPADQPVTVRLKVVENLAVVSVSDHGPGLPLEEQSRIWDWFHRVPGIEVQYESGESSGNLGLGLHICKQLIELHPGGHVGVESAVGEGATFWFQLPLAS
jgi:PAS domain S-box-containing protein